MANPRGAPENLNPVQSKEEAMKRGRNGGVKSGEARRRKRDMADAARLLLNMAVAGESLEGNLSKLGIKETDMTNQMAMLARIFQKVMVEGDVRGAEFLRDTAGYNQGDILRKDEFEYRKDKDMGIASEIEDFDEIEGLIYDKERVERAKGTESKAEETESGIDAETEESPEEENDTI